VGAGLGRAPREPDVTPSQRESAVLAVSDAPGTLEPLVRALEEGGCPSPRPARAGRPDPSSPARIVTVRKVGYRYNRPKR